MNIKANIDDLVILLAVYDTKGFSSAARLLSYPVAKITRAIANLESAYQLPLFVRTTRRTVATESCHAFVSAIRLVLNDIEDAESILMQHHVKPSGWLRVDAVSTFIGHQLIPIMSKFKTMYPHIHIELMTNDKIIDLIEKRTDVAIRVGQLADSSLHATFLGKSPLKLVATRNYFKSRQKVMPESINELLAHDIIGFTRQSKLNNWPIATRYLDEHPNCMAHPQIMGRFLPVIPCMTANSGEAILQLCLADHGIALLSQFTVARYLKNEDLIEIMPGLICDIHPRNDVHAVYYKNSTLSKRIEVFIDFLKNNLVI